MNRKRARNRGATSGFYSNQRGVIALMVTAVLLIGALAFALGSYRGVFFQIKVANNQIEARKAHWRAEGGLECGFSSIVLNSDTSIPIGLNTTCSDMGLASLQASSSDPERLIAKYGNREIGKTIIFTNDSGAGAIKSTSDLIVFGTTDFSPPDPVRKNSDGEYECALIVVNRNVVIQGTVVNQGVSSAVPPPSDGFDGSSDCADSHKTSAAGTVGIWQDSSNNYISIGVAQDFQRDETLNPFKALFDFERSEWEQVRDSPEYDFLSYTMSGDEVSCYDKFKNDLVYGIPNKIWIDGNCQLMQADLDAIEAVQQAYSGTYLFLLVHNGALAIKGDSVTLEGVIFHFNESFAANPYNWDKFDSTISDLMRPGSVFDNPISNLYDSTVTIPANSATYFQSGSFLVTGGMIFDTLGQMALFNQAMRLQYNSDITESFEFSLKPKWKKGSWSDH